MIGILILIAIAVGFSNYAKKNGLPRILWGFLGVVGYYGGAFLAGLVIALVDESIADNAGGLIISALVGAIFGVGGMYLLMRNVASNKRKQTANSEILDEEIH